MVATIHKFQGEHRERGQDGKLHATQRAKYFCSLRCSLAEREVFRSYNENTQVKARKHAEALFGPLEWRGTPEIEGMYGMAEIRIQEAH